MSEQSEAPPPDSFPQYAPPRPKGVRHIHPKQAGPLLKIFGKMLKRGKGKTLNHRQGPRKKVRIV